MNLQIPIFWARKSISQAASSPASAVGWPGCGWLSLFSFYPGSPWFPLRRRAISLPSRGSAIPARAPQHPTPPGHHVFRHAGSLPWLCCLTIVSQEGPRKLKKARSFQMEGPKVTPHNNIPCLCFIPQVINFIIWLRILLNSVEWYWLVFECIESIHSNSILLTSVSSWETQLVIIISFWNASVTAQVHFVANRHPERTSSDYMAIDWGNFWGQPL